MEAEHPHDQQKHGETPLGKLRRGGTCNHIGVDISTTHYKEYGRHVCRSGEYAVGKLFALPFIHKVKNYLTHSKKFNRTGPPESCEVCELDVPKFATWNHRVDLSHDRGRHVFQCQSPSSAQGRNAWRTENRDDVNDYKLKEIVLELDEPNNHLILCAKNRGAWMNVRGATVTKAVLVATEFRDF